MDKYLVWLKNDAENSTFILGNAWGKELKIKLS